MANNNKITNIDKVNNEFDFEIDKSLRVLWLQTYKGLVPGDEISYEQFMRDERTQFDFGKWKEARKKTLHVSQLTTLDGKVLKKCSEFIEWSENEIKKLKAAKSDYNENEFWKREVNEFARIVDESNPTNTEEELFIDECRDYLKYVSDKIKGLFNHDSQELGVDLNLWNENGKNLFDYLVEKYHGASGWQRYANIYYFLKGDDDYNNRTEIEFNFTHKEFKKMMKEKGITIAPINKKDNYDAVQLPILENHYKEWRKLNALN